MESVAVIGLLITIALGLASAEKAGRVDSENQCGFKCHSVIDSLQKCKEMRNKALSRGCITREEYDLLVKHYLCPVCDWDISGSEAYEGSCVNFVDDNDPAPREKTLPKAMQYRTLRIKD